MQAWVDRSVSVCRASAFHPQQQGLKRELDSSSAAGDPEASAFHPQQQGLKPTFTNVRGDVFTELQRSIHNNKD